VLIEAAQGEGLARSLKRGLAASEILPAHFATNDRRPSFYWAKK